MTLPNWAREPLVHFLAAGLVIYALLAWRGGDVDPASRTIDVDREQLAQISLVFERTMNRSPTDAELDAQIERYIRDEVLYREALRLGLDQDDAVVRRRMAQKMDILASSQAETVQPSVGTLRAHYDANQQAFASDVVYSLDQLWFEDRQAAERALLQAGGAADWRKLGESISLPPSVEGMDGEELADRFGLQFVQNLSALEVASEWQGPVGSGFGWHLVRLTAREPSKVPPFEEIQSDVEDHWRTQTIAERKEAAYKLLRDSYKVTTAR